MVWLAVALSVLIGLSLGLLGGGGSILTVPILVYVAGLEAKEAIATSLLVVGTTSAVAAVSHARAGRVRWRTGLTFGAFAMAGAYAGGRLAEYVPGTYLLLAFALMMLATAVAMIRGRSSKSDEPVPHELPIGKVALEGVVVGLVTGIVGAGGGFLVVPALVLLGGLPMSVAVGTSLVVIAMKSFAGFAGYLSVVSVDWVLAGWVTLAAVAGSLLGSRLAGRIPQDTLRKGFGWFVVVMGLFVLGQELPMGSLVSHPATWVAVVAVGAGGALWLARRRGRPAVSGPAPESAAFEGAAGSGGAEGAGRGSPR